MGRRKLEMELISKKGARMQTFHKRKEGLKKKLDELKTLCAVDACMIIYGPDRGVEPEVYPNDAFATCRIIDNYKSKSGDPNKCKTFGLKDFFEERQRKAEDELAKLRKERSEAKYPTWNDKLEEEKDPVVLRDFAQKLSAKSRYLKSMIQSMKEQEQGFSGGPRATQVVPPHMTPYWTSKIAGPALQGLVDNDNLNQFNYQFPYLVDGMGASSSTNYPQQYDWTGEGAMIYYNQGGGAVAAPPPMNRNVEYCLPTLPHSHVNEYQSEGNQEAYVMENDEGSQYLLPFHY